MTLQRRSLIEKLAFSYVAMTYTYVATVSRGLWKGFF